MARIGFILQFLEGIISITKYALSSIYYLIYPIFKVLIFIHQNLLYPLINIIKSFFLSPFINIILEISLNLIKIIKIIFSIFPNKTTTKNLSNLYSTNIIKEFKIIFKYLDFLTKPIRLLYTIICLSTGHIYNIFKIIYHNIYFKKETNKDTNKDTNKIK